MFDNNDFETTNRPLRIARDSLLLFVMMGLVVGGFVLVCMKLYTTLHGHHGALLH